MVRAMARAWADGNEANATAVARAGLFRGRLAEATASAGAASASALAGGGAVVNDGFNAIPSLPRCLSAGQTFSPRCVEHVHRFSGGDCLAGGLNLAAGAMGGGGAVFVNSSPSVTCPSPCEPIGCEDPCIPTCSEELSSSPCYDASLGSSPGFSIAGSPSFGASDSVNGSLAADILSLGSSGLDSPVSSGLGSASAAASASGLNSAAAAAAASNGFGSASAAAAANSPFGFGSAAAAANSPFGSGSAAAAAAAQRFSLPNL